jgi:hypothetical protein
MIAQRDRTEHLVRIENDSALGVLSLQFSDHRRLDFIVFISVYGVLLLFRFMADNDVSRAHLTFAAEGNHLHGLGSIPCLAIIRPTELLDKPEQGDLRLAADKFELASGGITILKCCGVDSDGSIKQLLLSRRAELSAFMSKAKSSWNFLLPPSWSTGLRESFWSIC